eukprot:7236068-Heterocapsa_arctica.AAC.1
MEAHHRLVGAIVGWGRRKSIHIMSIYGHDAGQNKREEGNRVLKGRVGRNLAAISSVPWVVGGDWNLQPEQFTIEGASCTAAYVEPRLANGAESKAESDAAVDKHKPVRLKIEAKLSDDMEMRVQRPVCFQGTTRNCLLYTSPSPRDA